MLELLQGGRSVGQVAKTYGVHPNSASAWKWHFLEKGAELFARDSTVAEYAWRIAELERLSGQKEIEPGLKKLLWPDQMSTEEKVEWVDAVREAHGLGPALAAVHLSKSIWYYHRRHKVSYEAKYTHLRPLLGEIAREHSDYGLLRITVELRDTYGQVVSHKVVQRLLKLWVWPQSLSSRPAP